MFAAEHAIQFVVKTVTSLTIICENACTTIQQILVQYASNGSIFNFIFIILLPLNKLTLKLKVIKI